MHADKQTTGLHPVLLPFSGQLCLLVGCYAIHQRHPASVPMQGDSGWSAAADSRGQTSGAKVCIYPSAVCMRTNCLCHHTSAPQRPPLPASAASMVERNPHYRSSQEELSQKASYFPPPSSSDLSLLPSSDSALPTHRFDKSSQSQPSSSVQHEMHSSQFQFTAPDKGDSSGSSSNTYYSLPASSQPTSTPSAAAATFARPSQGPEEKEKMWEAFLDSLREEDSALYNLTRQELENLVSVVVREKGFPKLVGFAFF